MLIYNEMYLFFQWLAPEINVAEYNGFSLTLN